MNAYSRIIILGAGQEVYYYNYPLKLDLIKGVFKVHFNRCHCVKKTDLINQCY